MKVALIYDRQYLDDYWKQGGVWSAYKATRLALETVGVEVTAELEDCDAVVFWDCLELEAKYGEYLKKHPRKALVKLGGYFQGDPDLGIPWELLGKADVVVVSSPDMIEDAAKRCGVRVEWIPDGYDPSIFYPADKLGSSLVACCGLEKYRGYYRTWGADLSIRIVGPAEPGWRETRWVVEGYEGQLPHEDMGDFLRQGQLFFSLIGLSKGFTISRLEALACGLPMVCTDQGWQYLCEGTAKVIPLEQLDSNPIFLSKTVASLTLPDLRRMRGAALTKAAEFTPEKVSRLWLDLLEGIL